MAVPPWKMVLESLGGGGAVTGKILPLMKGRNGAKLIDELRTVKKKSAAA